MSQCIIGCDIGGTAVKAALVNKDGSIVRSAEIPSLHGRGHEGFVKSVCDLVTRLAQGCSCDAVGLGIAGMLDPARTRLVNSPNMPLLNGIPLKQMLEQQLECPVYIENDANAAALGELHAGAGRTHSQFLFFTLGTGIGSGLILNKRLWIGEAGKAGEFGHVTVYPDGELCGCGRRGCLEAHASGTAIVRMAREAAQRDTASSLYAYRERSAEITPELVYRLAGAGDEASRTVFSSMARALAIAIAGVNNLLDIHTFIVGGGISRAYDLFCPLVMDELDRMVFGLSRGRINLLRAQLGNDAGVCGAAWAAREALSGNSP